MYSLVFALTFQTVAALPAASLPPALPATAWEVTPPVGWVALDPADSLWRAARARLDAGDARAAAALYRRIRTESQFRSSEYRAHAYYWEAFSRQRIGSASELRTARQVLSQLRRDHPRFENMGEVERLESRINSQLAAGGDAPAGSRVAERVAQVSAQCPDYEIQIAVVEALITMPAERAMPTLRQVMSRRDACSALLREKAVFIVAQKRSPESEALLLETLRSDPEPKVREHAVFWLSQVNSPRAIEAIEEILRTESDPKMLEHAVFALSQNRSPRAATLLRDIAGRAGAPRDVRKNAIFWLGQSSGGDTGQFLRSLYGSVTEPELKEAILFALSQRKDAGAGEFLLEIAMNTREPMQSRKQALFWAGQQQRLPLARIGQLYESLPDREMREQIIFTLSQRREPEAVERMIEIARRERDVELRKTAIFWLGQSRDPRAARYLTELVGG